MAEEAARTFSDMFERTIAQAKENQEKMTSVLQTTTGAFEEAFNAANKGSAEFCKKMVEMARAQANVGFDMAQKAVSAKSLTELLEVSSAHMRKQLEITTAQMKELAELSQRVMSDTATPMRTSMTEPFRLAS